MSILTFKVDLGVGVSWVCTEKGTKRCGLPAPGGLRLATACLHQQKAFPFSAIGLHFFGRTRGARRVLSRILC